MDFNQFFRGFFGSHNRRDSLKSPFPQEEYDPWSDDDNTDGSNHPVDPFLDGTTLNLFQHIEDMFNSMFSASFGVMDFPDIKMIEPNETSPRDRMLRDSSDCNQDPCCRKPFAIEDQEPLVDIDLDEQIAKEGLFALQKPEKFKSPQSFSFSKSISVRTVRLPDGTMEEHRTSTDSDGNKVTTVRRCLGDQSHEVTTHSNKHGFQEKNENFINMDEKDVSVFDRMWEKKKSGSITQTPAIDLPLKDSPKLQVPSGDPAYMSLFKKFFGLGPEK